MRTGATRALYRAAPVARGARTGYLLDMRHLAACLAPLALLAGCSSAEPEPSKPAAPAQAARPAGVTASSPAAAAPAPAPRSRGLPAEHVMFTVERRPLDEVLLIFESQVGIKVTWKGEPRPISLRLTQPTPWQDALGLVCQFSDTHLARDYQGRWQLKDGYGGTLGSDEDVNALLSNKDKVQGTTSPEGGQTPRAGSGARGGGAAPAAQGGGATPTRYNERGAGGLSKSEFGDAYGGGSGDTARKLLQGTSTTQSGR